MNKVELFLAAISGQPVPRFPIWMMRQAGRYMAAYQHTRKTYSFDQIGHAHQLMHDNKHPHGNMACLVNSLSKGQGRS